MKSKFELGEEVYVKAIVIRTGLKMGDKTLKVLYDLAVSTEHNTISLNNIGESEIERVVQQ